MAQLAPIIGPHLDQLKAHRNPAYKFKLLGTSEPSFDPSLPCALGRILRLQRGDPYVEVARALTAQNRLEEVGRTTAKVVTLSMANSITPTGLAARLGYSPDPAGRARAK